jgi:hypothetical protein
VSEINRRDALRLLAAVPVAGALHGAEGAPRLLPVLDPETSGRVADAAAAAAEQPAPYAPRFFTAREWRTLRVLVDDIIPRDDRSGSATEAGVPEYIDFVLADQTPARGMAPTPAQTSMRGGLAWLDGESRRRFAKSYARCTAAERHRLLDDIAWPERAAPEMRHGVAFFTRVRDMTASGFFSSRMGVRDLRYLGNVFVAEWKGCPEEALRKLGVE